MRIEYSGTVNEELWMRSQRLHMGRRLTIVPWLFPIVMTLLAWGWHFILPFRQLSALGMVFAIGCLYPPLMWFLVNRKLTSTFRSSPYIKERFQAAISDEGLAYESMSGSGTIPWQHFIFRKESDDLLLLYRSANFYNVLPREFFASQDGFDQARAFVAQRVPVRK